jgi:hypothetical protein
VFANGSHAFKTSELDTVTGLSGAWHESEFNVIGDGSGSEAMFNKGSSVTVKITATSGSTAAPTCIANDGTTGETNNLTLGACKGTGGSTPNIQFTKTNQTTARLIPKLARSDSAYYLFLAAVCQTTPRPPVHSPARCAPVCGCASAIGFYLLGPHFAAIRVNNARRAGITPCCTSA